MEETDSIKKEFNGIKREIGEIKKELSEVVSTFSAQSDIIRELLLHDEKIFSDAISHTNNMIDKIVKLQENRFNQLEQKIDKLSNLPESSLHENNIKMSPNEAKFVNYLFNHAKVTAEEVKENTGVGPSTISQFYNRDGIKDTVVLKRTYNRKAYYSLTKNNQIIKLLKDQVNWKVK
jgi:predicted nuclease with TOPRIM domain